MSVRTSSQTQFTRDEELPEEEEVEKLKTEKEAVEQARIKVASREERRKEIVELEEQIRRALEELNEEEGEEDTNSRPSSVRSPPAEPSQPQEKDVSKRYADGNSDANN